MPEMNGFFEYLAYWAQEIIAMVKRVQAWLDTYFKPDDNTEPEA